MVLFFIYPLKFLAQVLINFGVLHQGFGINFDIGFTGGFDYYNIFIIYGAGGFAVWFTIVLMYLHAYNKRKILGLDNNELEITTNAIVANFIVSFVAAVSIMLTILDMGYLSGWIYFAISPLIFLGILFKEKYYIIN